MGNVYQQHVLLVSTTSHPGIYQIMYVILLGVIRRYHLLHVATGYSYSQCDHHPTPKTIVLFYLALFRQYV